MRSVQITALFIDIDHTIIRFKPGYETDCLFQIVHRAGVQLTGLSPEETSSRIERIKREIRWWHWSDFIVALELNPREFWQYALEEEKNYLEPTGPEMRAALERLRDAGFLLYITSNNPSSGILHKLNIAGLGSVREAPLFSQVLGPPELQALKKERLYWQKALAHLGLEAGEVAVVGDNPKDDCEVPLSVGLAHSFLINRGDDLSRSNSGRVTHVMNFDQIANQLLLRTSTLQG